MLIWLGSGFGVGASGLLGLQSHTVIGTYGTHEKPAGPELACHRAVMIPKGRAREATPPIFRFLCLVVSAQLYDMRSQAHLTFHGFHTFHNQVTFHGHPTYPSKGRLFPLWGVAIKGIEMFQCPSAPVRQRPVSQCPVSNKKINIKLKQSKQFIQTFNPNNQNCE